MPTYRYECLRCGEFEAEHGMNDGLTVHSCGQPVKKLLSQVTLMTREVEKASYFAGKEGNQRMAMQMAQNASVAKGIKEGNYADPKKGPEQPQSIYNDLERRLKSA